MKLKYYKELDGIRAMAALMVIFFHFFSGVSSNNSFVLLLKKISIFGQTGVSLFFVLSGFLITRILLEAKNKANYFSSFYVRRILRIIPLYYFFLIIFYFIVPLIFKSQVVSLNKQIYYWVYMQNFAMTFNWIAEGPLHFWSLAIEEHFYIFWPFVIYFFNNTKILYAIAVLVLISFFTRYFLLSNNYDVFYFTFSRLDELALGALLAIIEMKKYYFKLQNRIFSMLLVSTLIISILIWFINNASGNDYLQIFKFLVLGLAYFAFIGYIITSKNSNLLKKFFQLKIFSFTGRISYGLYVYHPLCFSMFYKFFMFNNIFLNFICCLLLSFLFATTSYYLIEVQFLKLKKYWNYAHAS